MEETHDFGTGNGTQTTVLPTKTLDTDSRMDSLPNELKDCTFTFIVIKGSL